MKNKRYKRGDPHPTDPDKVFWGYINSGKLYWVSHDKFDQKNASIRLRNRAKTTLGDRKKEALTKSDAVRLKKEKDPWKRGDVHPETGLFFDTYAKCGGLYYEYWRTEEEFNEIKARRLKNQRRRKKPKLTRKQIKEKAYIRHLEVKKKYELDRWHRGDRHPTTGLYFDFYLKCKGRLYEYWTTKEQLTYNKSVNCYKALNHYWCRGLRERQALAYQRKQRKKRVTKMTKALLGLGDKLNKIQS
jgi:hypothetical protein